jgi:EAL domain-containing protein (putative c-di-GMP-specific phosphodiesterase class I)
VDAEVLARRIATAFAAPFTIGDTELTITASVGTAYSVPGEDFSAQLLFDADIAMYQAKRHGGARHQMFDPRAARRMTDDRSLGKELRGALALGQLDVAYLPVVRSVDGLVTGVEALLRWTDSERGVVSASAMIAAAEQSNLINDVGEWILERACRDRADWLEVHRGSLLELAVNVSGRQLMSADFVATVSAVLERTGTDPASLILEITEAAFFEDEERSITVLRELKAMGIRLALDDFGTGYSALRYLHRMPLDIVKIDRAIVADLAQAHAVDAIIAAVTDLAHAVGLSVTAEGVETQRQHDEITSGGCDAAQGYFYARPMSAFAFGTHLGAVGAAALQLPAPTPEAGPSYAQPGHVSVIIPVQTQTPSRDVSPDRGNEVT